MEPGRQVININITLGHARSGAARVTILLLFLVFVPGLALAMGQQEDPIDRAENLIEENRLNEAILVLEQTIRDEPDRIHEAENLLRRIRRLRGSYNELFQQLIAHLIENPQDIETTLDIIDRMEALDEEPNPRTQQQVAQARYIAQLAFDRDRVERAMNEARQALQEERYLDAISIYVGLRDVQRETFDERGYSQIFRNSVDEAVAEVYASTEGFQGISGSVIESSTQLLSSLQSPEDPTSPGPFPIDQLLADLTEVTRLRDLLDEAATTVRDQRDQVRLQFPEDPVDWYLVFQDQIARGRSEYRGEEGILPAIRQFANRQIDRSLQVARQEAEGRREAAISAFEAGSYSTAESLFPRMTPYYEVVRRLVAAHEEVYVAAVALGAAETEFSEENLDQYLAATFRATSGSFSADLSSTMVTIPPLAEDLPEDLTLLNTTKAAVREGVDMIQQVADSWQTQVTDVADQIERPTLPPGSAQAAQLVTDRMRGRLTAVQRQESRASVAIIARNYEELSRERNQIEATLPDVAQLVEGSEAQLAQIAEGEDIQISRYPDQALDRYQQLQERSSEIVGTIQSVISRFSDERAYISNDEEVQSELDRMNSLLQQSQSVAATIASRIQEMEAQIAEAEDLRQQADQLVSETRAALSALQVATARDLWEQAREAYYNSLSIQEDVAFRNEVDDLVLSLGNEIQEAQNRLVVREVRDLINEASALYNQDEFGAARDNLAQAEQLWSQVYVDPNPEVQRLLRLVNAALSIQEGRTLTETDPLFPVLGNYLNLAQQDFREGEDLYESGREAEGERLLNRAIENLRNIRDVRPLNWNARILELRILQITAEDNFPQVFAARYQDAVERIEEGELLAVYGELEALAEINPNYPGLQQRMRQLEIELNLREDPVDQARVAESNQLYSQAQRLAQAGSRDQAVVAVNLLEEAIDLNPNNQDAKFLMDSLRIRIGGQATVALNSADEQQYRLAETLFAQGQVARAFSIVERLLADPDNQGYPPLIELRRRIALRLGI